MEHFFVPPAQVDAPLELGQGELVVAHLVVSARQIETHPRIVGPLDLFSLEDPNIEVAPALFGFRVEDFSVHKTHPEVLARDHDILSRVNTTQRRKFVDGIRVMPAIKLPQSMLRRREHHLHLQLHVCRLPNHPHALAADVGAPGAALLLEAPSDGSEAPHAFEREIGVGHESVGCARSVRLEAVVPGGRKVDKGFFDQLTGNGREVAPNHVLRAVCRPRVHDRPVVDVRCRGAHRLSHRAGFILDDHREPQRGAVGVIRYKR